LDLRRDAPGQLTVGNHDAADGKIRSVCRTTQVWESPPDVPDGLDVELGDDGIRQSGGQRRRVAVAPLLTDVDVLQLDEATTDLDTGLERRVHATTERTSGDYADLVITTGSRQSLTPTGSTRSGTVR
jgi:subfamily B ATP-binding cassette protein MsbA